MPSPAPGQTSPPAAVPTSGPDQDVTIEPTRPAALDDPPTEDNAVAVGKYFMTLFPYAVATGDLTAWEALSGDGCRYCSTLHDIVTAMKASGQRGVGGAYDVGPNSGSRTGSDTFMLAVALKQYPSQTLAADFSVVDDYPDVIHYRANIEVSWVGHGWKVDGVNMDELGRARARVDH